MLRTAKTWKGPFIEFVWPGMKTRVGLLTGHPGLRKQCQLSQDMGPSNSPGVVSAVSGRAHDVIAFLLPRLREKVFTEDDRNMLNKVRSILDLKTIVSKIRTLGAVTVANTH